MPALAKHHSTHVAHFKLYIFVCKCVHFYVFESHCDGVSLYYGVVQLSACKCVRYSQVHGSVCSTAKCMEVCAVQPSAWKCVPLRYSQVHGSVVHPLTLLLL